MYEKAFDMLRDPILIPELSLQYLYNLHVMSCFHTYTYDATCYLRHIYI